MESDKATGTPEEAPEEGAQGRSQKQPLGGRLLEWLGVGAKGEKTGLDLIQVMAALSTPIVVAVGGYLFTMNQNAQREEIEEQRVQDDTLREYFSTMESLVLNEDLRNAEPGDEAAAAARARTLTVLENLDPDRKRRVLIFLYESDLISGGASVVNLYGANLSGVDLSYTALPLANLGDPLPSSLPKRVQEGKPEGPHAGLVEVTNLSGANLEGASLEGANLPGFNLTEANLSNANLKKAVLGGAETSTPAGSLLIDHLSLRGANLSCADLSNAQIKGTDWSGADLSKANLSGVKLGPAHIISQEQLDQAFGDENTQLHPFLRLQPPPSWNDNGDRTCRWQQVTARQEAQEKGKPGPKTGPKKEG